MAVFLIDDCIGLNEKECTKTNSNHKKSIHLVFLRDFILCKSTKCCKNHRQRIIGVLNDMGSP